MAGETLALVVTVRMVSTWDVLQSVFLHTGPLPGAVLALVPVQDVLSAQMPAVATVVVRVKSGASSVATFWMPEESTTVLVD